MKVTVHAGSAAGRLVNFWNHVHFHPTDAVEDLWGRNILDKIAADHVAQYVRLHTMFEDIVTRGENGKLVFDFSVSDRRIDYMVSKGFRLLLCFDFMPPCMSLDMRNVSGLRYKNKTYNRSKPSDWNEWKTVCETYTEHLLERYGKETVESWFFHCWNEPDAGYWLSKTGNDEWDALGLTDKIDEYIKLYDYFEAGVSAADPGIRVGGPSCAGSDRFIRLFLEHCSGGRNTLSGKTGTRIDFIGVHCYSQGIYSNLPNTHWSSPDNIIQRLRTVRNIANAAGFPETELFLDEFGISGGGFLGVDRDPRMIFRETEYFSAFFARLIDRILHMPELKLSKMMICLSGQDHCVKDFDGFRTFFTANGFTKPVYNGYRLCSKLEGEYLEKEIELSDPRTGVVAAKADDGTIRVMLYSFTDDFYGNSVNVPVELTVDGAEGGYLRKHWRIDRECSNAHAAWALRGSPTAPSMYDRGIISEAGNLSEYLPRENVRAEQGKISDRIILTRNAVSLIELIPINTEK